jgi:hypothetical protein
VISGVAWKMRKLCLWFINRQKHDKWSLSENEQVLLTEKKASELFRCSAFVKFRIHKDDCGVVRLSVIYALES